jgi:hypothetical protein
LTLSDAPAVLVGLWDNGVCLQATKGNAITVIARSEATKQAIYELPYPGLCIASPSLSSGAHSRDPLAPTRWLAVTVK